ncbi:MAG: TOBE domain-containing protein, partial [Oscillospiraceae bacterium]|nr:TOBE domain-containing protein [Oscillospiraceae bacterium]
TPQMNFFRDAELKKNGNTYSVEILGKEFVLPEDKQEKLRANGVEPGKVIAGVRPVHLSIADDGIPAVVDVSEMMGSELHLHMDVNGNDVVAVVPTADLGDSMIANHQSVHFTMKPNLIHLFDTETEKSLL